MDCRGMGGFAKRRFCVLIFKDGRAMDILSTDVRRGKDIQGIPWNQLSITREKYRQTRLEQYKNYENVLHSGLQSAKA